jgi:biopolymer transport protein ExbD
MAKTKRTGPAGDVSINMTPMIDCTFQLIIFFILTTQFASQALSALELHKPVESEAKERGFDPDKAGNVVIVNVTSKVEPESRQPKWRESAKAEAFVISGDTIEVHDEKALRLRLEQERDNAIAEGVPPEEFFVEVRADRRISSAYVLTVLRACSQAGIGKIHVTALREGA